MKKKSGGAREGAGRKPLPLSEKKSTLRIYIKNSLIDNLGGKDILRERLLKTLELWNLES